MAGWQHGHRLIRPHHHGRRCHALVEATRSPRHRDRSSFATTPSCGLRRSLKEGHPHLQQRSPGTSLNSTLVAVHPLTVVALLRQSALLLLSSAVSARTSTTSPALFVRPSPPVRPRSSSRAGRPIRRRQGQSLAKRVKILPKAPGRQATQEDDAGQRTRQVRSPPQPGARRSRRKRR